MWRPSLAEAVAQRRRVAVRLREFGLSYSQIAAATGSAVATIERDLAAVPHRAPAWVLRRDGKRHPYGKDGRPEA